jgi:hypothetical protein
MIGRIVGFGRNDHVVQHIPALLHCVLFLLPIAGQIPQVAIFHSRFRVNVLDLPHRSFVIGLGLRQHRQGKQQHANDGESRSCLSHL